MVIVDWLALIVVIYSQFSIYMGGSQDILKDCLGWSRRHLNQDISPLTFCTEGSGLSAFLFVAKVWLSRRHLTSLEADTGWKQLLGIIFFWICVFKDILSAAFLVRWLKLYFQVLVLVNFIILELLLALL